MDATTADQLAPTLAGLRATWQAGKPEYAQRRDDLTRLREALADGLDDMAATVDADFGGRPRAESLLADGMAVLTAIDHLRRHLRRWMRPRRVATGWRLWPARAQLRHVPLGVVGVMSPWNYPVSLALVPLATAIAAGNHVYLKPSEHTPRTSTWLQALLARTFPATRVAVAQGDAELAAAFSALPFDHLLFTGSTEVGRKVMAAAAANLTPVTLELGGKSPALICPDYPLERAAARLAQGKWFNAGQTCIAPDYVLVDAARLDELVGALHHVTQQRYGHGNGADFARIINDARHRRLTTLLDDARGSGLRIETLLALQGERVVAPTVVVDPGPDSALMREEIFGPILPLIGYRTLDEAIAFINARPRPLALYPFGNDRRMLERILHDTVAGGVTVNNTLLHYTADGLPFGGVGTSGMGAYHGRAGFDAMSKALPVLWQPLLNPAGLLRPPYARVERLLRMLVR
ncbi:MAG: coniferyl aldehyde dehydrogenase [Pseudoxanthomonas suwonensis]|nr:coniferyl aldehyde dehydrogenase [Pseudoxanthomonas suwonensis]